LEEGKSGMAAKVSARLKTGQPVKEWLTYKERKTK